MTTYNLGAQIKPDKRKHKSNHIVSRPLDSTKISAAEPGSTEKENEFNGQTTGADTSLQVVNP